MKLFSVALLAATMVVRPAVELKPELPPFLKTDELKGAWVSHMLQEAPPAGGEVSVLGHYPPVYNEKNKLWVITFVVTMRMADIQEYEIVYCRYFSDTRASDIALVMRPTPGSLNMFLNSNGFVKNIK